MQIPKIIGPYLLMAVIFASCQSQPAYVQQVPVQQVAVQPAYAPDQYANQQYDVVQGANNQQYALVTMNGVQQYILYSTFMGLMNNGGYGNVYHYYQTNPGYFRTYNRSYNWRPVSHSTYGSYVNSRRATQTVTPTQSAQVRQITPSGFRSTAPAVTNSGGGFRRVSTAAVSTKSSGWGSSSSRSGGGFRSTSSGRRR